MSTKRTCILFRLARNVLLRSFKERIILFCVCFEFFATYETQKNIAIFCVIFKRMCVLFKRMLNLSKERVFFFNPKKECNVFLRFLLGLKKLKCNFLQIFCNLWNTKRMLHSQKECCVLFKRMRVLKKNVAFFL